MSMKLRQFDPALHLDSEEAIALYLEEIIEGDPDLLAVALGDVARARGMTELAEKTGLARESLYQALSENGNPTYSTIRKVLDAFGVRISIKPQHERLGTAG